jgi:hemoglobin
MKPDITTRLDIEKMVDLFYQKVVNDDLLSGFFAKTNWEKHLPKMYGFWNNAIFYTGGYTGDPLAKHKKLHEKQPLSQRHFDRWEELFFKTIDELFEGANANLAKQRAGSIATIMQTKIL